MRQLRFSRKWKRVLAAGGLAVLALVLLSPVWFPWMVAWLLAREGVRSDQIDRQGFSRFRIDRLEWKRERFTVTLEDLELPQPLAWGWSLVRGGEGDPLVRAARVRIEGGRSEDRPESGSGGLPKTLGAMQKLAATLNRWTPLLQAGHLDVQWDAVRLKGENLRYDRGLLQARLTPEGRPSVQVRMAIGSTIQLDAALESEPLRLHLEAHSAPASAQLAGVLDWQGQQAEVHAEFGPVERIPLSASLHAPRFEIQAARLGLEGYEMLRGSLEWSWADRQWNGELLAEASPDPGSDLPRLHAAFSADGDLERLRVRRMTASAPMVQVHLSRPMEILLNDFRPQTEARLEGTLDLSRQAWWDAGGRLAFVVESKNSSGEREEWPSLRWSAQGNDLRLGTRSFPRAGAHGFLQWPLLEVSRANLLLEEGMEVESVVRASLDRSAVDHFSLRLRHPSANLSLAGSAQWDEATLEASLQEVVLTRPGEEWGLAQAFRVVMDRASGEVRVPRFELRSGASRMEGEGTLRWPEEGRLQLGGSGLRPGSLLHEGVPAIEVEQLTWAAEWNRGPVRMNASTRLRLVEEPDFTGRLVVETDGSRLKVVELGVLHDSEQVLSGKGSLPFRLELDPWSLSFPADEPSAFEWGSRPAPRFWERLGRLMGVELKDLFFAGSFQGTLSRPEGWLDLKLSELRWLRWEEAPPVRDVNARFELSFNRIRLDPLTFRVESEEVRAALEAPLQQEGTLGERVQWRQVQGSVSIPRVELPAWAAYLPGFLEPEGVLAAGLHFEPGPSWRGFIHLTGLRTGPLPSIGRVHALGAEVRLEGQQAVIEEVTALIGGEPVALSGRIDLKPWLESGAAPEWSGALRGGNLPLVRRSDLVVRASPDLALQGRLGEETLISGRVVLGRSFLLQNLESLAPGGLESPRQRPPYFSLEAPFVRDWKLEVTVEGSEFLTVRTPLFEGKASARLQLTGTLQTPLALGEVRVASGHIRFPFASLPVTRGLVLLTPAQPHRPELDIAAAARLYGYDVTLQISGPADDPEITFQSIPPLSSEEVLMMLTAGEIPRSGFGFTTQQRAARIGAFFGRSLIQRWVGRPGKESRLSVQSGQEISEEGRPTYSLEYRLTEDWSIVGEYDRFNDFNVGVRWRFYSR